VIILALDTCLGACSVAITDAGRVLATRSEPMTRGHQERLAPMAAEAAGEAKVPFRALDRIAVTVGPGSFTGLRVGLAFAKGVALALRRPCVGVGTLAALAASADLPGVTVALIGAGRGAVYIQAFDRGLALMAPDRLPIETAAARLAEIGAGREMMLVGPGAALLAGIFPRAPTLALAAPSPEAVSRLASASPEVPPRPLYLRPPDAKVKTA